MYASGRPFNVHPPAFTANVAGMERRSTTPPLMHAQPMTTAGGTVAMPGLGAPNTIPLRQPSTTSSVHAFVPNPFRSLPSSPSKAATSNGPVPPGGMGMMMQPQQLPYTGDWVVRSNSVAPQQQQQQHRFTTVPSGEYASNFQQPQLPYSVARQQQSQQSMEDPVTVNAMAHYEQRLDQERQRLFELDREEAEMAAEEAHLKRQLAELSAASHSSRAAHMSLHQGWEQIMAQEQWYYTTANIDVSSEVSAIQYRCQALQHHLEELQLVLQGHQAELRKYDGNDVVRQRQRETIRMLEDCMERMERRRQAVRRTAECHFDAEGQRERASRRYLSEIGVKFRELQKKLGGAAAEAVSKKQGTSNESASTSLRVATSFNIRRNAQNTLSSSRPQSRQPSHDERSRSVPGLNEGLTVAPLNRQVDPSNAKLPLKSVPSNTLAPQSQDQQQSTARQRIVSFRSLSNASASNVESDAHIVAQRNGLDEASFTVALDDESVSFPSGRGSSAPGFDDEEVDHGLNGSSFSMSFYGGNTKRRRLDDAALTAI